MPIFNKLIYNGTEYDIGGSGGNIGEPLDLTVTTVGTDATITWTDNEIGTIPPTSFAKSELVRKVGSAPTSPSDGTLVVTETVKDTYKNTGYVDSGLTEGTTYYYRVFSYSDLGGISYCDAVSVTPSSGWQPSADTIAYWKFDGDMTDEMGSYDVTSSTITTDFTSLPGDSSVKCLHYSDNGEGGLAIPGSIWLNIGTAQSDFTLLFWRNPTTLGVHQRFYISGGAGWCIANIGYTTNDDGVVNSLCIALGNNGWNYDQCSYSPTLNGWQLLGFTYDHTTRKKSYYANGQLIGEVTAGQDYNTTSSTSNNNFARYKRGGEGYISNEIFEKKVWSGTDMSNYFVQTKALYGIS